MLPFSYTLSRNRNKDYRQFYSSFPSRARLGTIGEYPEQTRGELEKLRFPENLRGIEKQPPPLGQKARLQAIVVSVIGISLLLIVIVGLLDGLYTIGKWLTGLFK